MVRPLYADDMDVQYKKLFRAVSLVVDCMDDLDMLVLILLQALGKAHAAFGTVQAHYEAETECFLWMLNSYICEKMPNNNAVNWIFEVTNAWEWAWTLIVGSIIMADGGDEAMEEARHKVCRKIGAGPHRFMGRLVTKQHFNPMDATSTATIPNDIHIIELIFGDNSHELVVLKACSNDTPVRLCSLTE